MLRDIHEKLPPASFLGSRTTQLTCDASPRYRSRSRYAVGRVVFVDRRISTRFAFDSEQLVFLGILLDELDWRTYQGGLFEGVGHQR